MNKLLFFFSVFTFISCSSNKSKIVENGYEGIGRIKNNYKEGRWIYKDGTKVTTIGHFSKGIQHGKWKYLNAGGKVHQKGNFIKDKRNGIWKFYYDDGKLMKKCRLIDNRESGHSSWYYRNGKLYTIRIYVDGKLDGIKSCFDKFGEPLDCGKIINGNGFLLHHDIENETNKIDKYEIKEGLFIQNYR